MALLMMAQKQGRSEAGVSLVETLVALLILSFVSVSTLAMFSQGMRLNRAGSDYTSITNIAKDKIEELLSLPYVNADLTPDTVMTETISKPDLMTITWRVAEHSVVKGATNISAVFAGGEMTSTAVAGNGNVKVIAVTVASNQEFAVGRRHVTLQGIKIRD
jgi:Tfp pilus assembly protein PilV